MAIPEWDIIAPYMKADVVKRRSAIVTNLKGNV